NAEQRLAAAAILGGTRDQAGDLDQLHAAVVDVGDRGRRPRGRERVVAGFDLDARQRLQKRRLAGVRRADERHLRDTVGADGERVVVERLLAYARLLDLRVDPLAQVGVGAVLVLGQVPEGYAQLLDSLAALLADEATLDHLLGDTMRNGHQAVL